MMLTNIAHVCGSSNRTHQVASSKIQCRFGAVILKGHFDLGAACASGHFGSFRTASGGNEFEVIGRLVRCHFLGGLIANFDLNGATVMIGHDGIIVVVIVAAPMRVAFGITGFLHGE